MKKYQSKMKKQAWLWLVIAAFAFLIYAGFPVTHTTAQGQKVNHVLGSYDVRVAGSQTYSQLIQNRLNAARQNSINRSKALTAAIAQLKAKLPGARVQLSQLTTSAEIVENTKGALTAASGSSAETIVRNFLRENAAIYGIEPAEVDQLHFKGESVSPKNGLRMVRLEQIVNDIPVFQSDFRALVDRNGRLVRTVGLLAPASKGAESFSQINTPAQSLVSAMSGVKINLDSSKVTINWLNAAHTKADVSVSDSSISGTVSSKLTYFALAPGVLIPAWSQVAFTAGNADWYTLIDAQSGALLWRKNIRSDVSTQQARFSVYVQADGIRPADSPAPQSPNTVAPGSGTQFPAISRTIVNMLTAQNPIASPNGWINDGGTTTTGNNVDAYLDTNADNNPDTGVLDNNGRPVGNPDANSLNRDFLGTTPRDFNYTPAPSGGNPNAGDSPATAASRRGAVTQLFYITNWYHDQLFALGFDEAAGNFQTTNFSGMGLGGDAVRAEAQDGSGTNNANFSTPPDGDSGRMQMFIFNFPTPDRDGDLDSEIVMHELTHGLSNRLIGDGGGLNWDIGGGMGEGWSDFFALSLLNNTNADDPNARYASGAYATYQLGGLTDNYVYGIRRFPYSTDNTVNPLTWADVDDTTANMSGGIPPSPLGFEFNGGAEVHNVGEVWMLSLWEMRSRIIADPAGANGNVPTGNQTSLQLVTDALKMTPINPSFIDARDAIIAADGATNSYANEASIWGGFADRGLGYKAVAPLGISGFGNLGSTGIGESFSLPYLDATGVTFNDTTGGNGNGGVDPGETILITVPLFNPWHAASKNVASATATLTTSTAGLTITDNSSTYGAIPAQGTTSGDTFAVQIPSDATCGQSLNFTVQVVSSLGTTSTTFSLRVGVPSGTGAPITYTRTPGSPIAIPDNDPRGITDSQTITDDFQIADINFRVDNIQHTFTGDLNINLKAPNGYSPDLIWLREILFGGGDGDNFINTVIDDESANDLNQSEETDAPYTGSWAPAFNSSVWLLFGDPTIFPDSVGQLSRMDGLSTLGTWRIHVADNFAQDTGTLNSWSMIVTPVAYACTPFVACNVTCPANVTVANDPNQCGAVVNYPPPTTSGSCTVTCTPPAGSFFPVGTTTVTCSSGGGSNPRPTGQCATQTITQSSSQTIEALNSVSCNNGVGHTDNSYYRAFTLSSFGIGTAFDVSAVQIGIEDAISGGGGLRAAKGITKSKKGKVVGGRPAGGGQPLTVNLYTSSTAFPTGFPGSLTLIGTASTTVADQSGTILTVPVTGTAPAGSQLVVEVFTPDGEKAGNLFFIGSNTAAETGPSYLRAPDCGITTPTATSAIGFPDMHIVLNVLGCAQGGGGTGPSCTFTVTVNDTQPPAITCPANVVAVAAPTCPVSTTTTVTYTTPTATDNCPGVTTVCTPPSGSTFPIGTTTVTCTATDAAGNTATCSFTVKVFNVCVQDRSNPNAVLAWNTATGEYTFCCNGTTFSGVGKVKTLGCTYTLDHSAATLRVTGKVDFSTFRGEGGLQSPIGTVRCSISDNDVRDNNCACVGGVPPAPAATK